MRLYIDINTGQLKRNVDGAPLGPLVLYLKNVLPLELVWLDGTESVTSTVMADNATLRVGIKSQPNGVILALATVFTLNNEVLLTTLNLNTTALVGYFNANVTAGIQSANLYFEIQVVSADETSEVITYHQSKCVVNRNINSGSDIAPSPNPVDTALYVLKSSLFDANGRSINPSFVGFRGEVTQLVGGTSVCLDFIQTLTLTLPTAFIIKVTGAGGQLWVLEQDIVTVADGEWIVDPVDYDADTNPRKWKRYL